MQNHIKNSDSISPIISLLQFLLSWYTNHIKTFLYKHRRCDIKEIHIVMRADG